MADLIQLFIVYSILQNCNSRFSLKLGFIEGLQ